MWTYEARWSITIKSEKFDWNREEFTSYFRKNNIFSFDKVLLVIFEQIKLLSTQK